MQPVGPAATQTQAWAASAAPRAGLGAAAQHGQSTGGTETEPARQVRRLSRTKLWHELSWTTAALLALLTLGIGASLDSAPSSGLGEDKAGLLLQWDGTRPPGCG